MTTITILAEDIKTSNYFDSYDCAVTRALKRAGLDEHRDHGMGIQNGNGTDIIPFTLPEYKQMRSMVLGMYRTAGKLKDTFCEEGLGHISHIIPVPLKDFSITLPI